MLYYDLPLYRPPSEAKSLILQVTLGCSHNSCTFCSMYKNKIFTIKSFEKIKEEIDFVKEKYRDVEKIFLADGDALVIPFEKLKKILEYIKENFKSCKKITCYATTKSILMKSKEELEELKELGLEMIYLGIESGDDKILKEIEKGCTSEEMIKAGKRVKSSGIKLSVTVISGIAGRKNSYNHSINTGKLISKINPDYLGILSLYFEEETKLYKDYLSGRFELLDNKEMLLEIKEILKNIEAKEKIIFRANHSSNYLLLAGELPKDKEKLIKEIEDSISKGRYRDEISRRL